MDVLVAALAHPAGRLVDRPVRDLVHRVLEEQGYASPEEVAALKSELEELRSRLAGLAAQQAELDRRARELTRLLNHRSLGAAGPGQSG